MLGCRESHISANHRGKTLCFSVGMNNRQYGVLTSKVGENDPSEQVAVYSMVVSVCRKLVQT